MKKLDLQYPFRELSNYQFKTIRNSLESDKRFSVVDVGTEGQGYILAGRANLHGFFNESNLERVIGYISKGYIKIYDYVYAVDEEAKKKLAPVLKTAKKDLNALCGDILTPS